MRAALTCHSGGFFGSSLQGSQAVYTPFWKTVKLPLLPGAQRGALRGRADLLPEVQEVGLRRGRLCQHGEEAGERKRGAGAPRIPGRQVKARYAPHHPSSWYNNATKPVRPPTTTGS